MDKEITEQEALEVIQKKTQIISKKFEQEYIALCRKYNRRLSPSMVVTEKGVMPRLDIIVTESNND